MTAEYSELFQKYFDNSIKDCQRLSHNGNNKLFCVTLKNNSKYIIKKYSEIHLENWKRGYSEFKALDYLWKKGFRNIPEPIRFDESENLGICSFERGFICKPSEIKEKDVSSAVDFLVRLHNLTEGKQDFGPASSACLCLREYVNVIDRRFSKIKDYKKSSEISERARVFLDKEVYQKIKEIKEYFFDKTKEMDISKELDLEEQVLTPGDFGFHNILFDKGDYKFLDFEYFGRDDHVRQILDFMHHDKSSGIPLRIRNLFSREYKLKRNTSEFFDMRIKILDPLIAMTWVLIYLNVLSTKYMDHVKFSHTDSKNLLEERLNKAKNKIRSIKVK